LWKSFKKWIALQVSAIEQEAYNVDLALANLKPDPNLSGVQSALVSSREQSFNLLIDPDGGSVEECLQIARKLLASFQETNRKALSTASGDLLGSYNDNWREYSEMGEDGRYIDVSNPKLTPSEFETIIKISSVSVIGQMVQFIYSDSGLFAGHSIVVTSFDGLNFSETSSEIFG